ncbi:MAG: hypothetical protein U0169_03975 [Polyangiaceae bacterium]
MSNSSAAPKRPSAPYKRSMKNYLIDSRFQLKYTGIILSIALVISGVLGVFLYRTSREVVAQSQQVVAESKKVSDIVKMSIKDDPIYSQNPELGAAVSSASSETDKKIEEKQRELVHSQATMLQVLVGSLSLMVVLIGLLGIVITHKIAGPIYKMKLLLKQVGDGKLVFEGRLRKGDELQDFFEAFQSMTEKLRDRQRKEVEELEAAMAVARQSGASEDSIAKIGNVRDKMKAAIDL